MAYGLRLSFSCVLGLWKMVQLFDFSSHLAGAKNALKRIELYDCLRSFVVTTGGIQQKENWSGYLDFCSRIQQLMMLCFQFVETIDN
ncbi:hypothetical protein ACFX2B_002809 [Malus domestica]